MERSAAVFLFLAVCFAVAKSITALCQQPLGGDSNGFAGAGQVAGFHGARPVGRRRPGNSVQLYQAWPHAQTGAVSVAALPEDAGQSARRPRTKKAAMLKASRPSGRPGCKGGSADNVEQRHRLHLREQGLSRLQGGLLQLVLAQRVGIVQVAHLREGGLERDHVRFPHVRGVV